MSSPSSSPSSSSSSSDEAAVPGSAPGDPASEPNTLIRTPVGSSFGPDLVLDPRDVPSRNVSLVLFDIFEPIVTLTADGEVGGGAAEAATLSDDGMTWTFELHDDRVWSDGEAVTAADFALRHQTPFGWPIPEISEVVVDGDHTLRIVATSPYALSLASLASIAGMPLPAHAAPDLETPWGQWDHRPSNGAYTLELIDDDGHIHLQKNELAAQASEVAFDRVVHQHLDWEAAAQGYLAGEVDLITEVPQDQNEYFAETSTLISGSTESVYYYLLNTEQPELADPRVRQALFGAIDRGELVEWVVDTGGTPTFSMVPAVLRTWPDEPDDLSALSDDRIETAKRLMTDAGYSATNRLVITISGHDTTINRRIGRFVALGWQEIYVDVEFDYSQTDISAWFDSVGQGAYDVATMRRTPPQSPATFLDPCFQPEPQPYCGFNGGAQQAAQLAEALGADESERSDAFRDLDAQLTADAPLIPLFHYANQMLPSADIRVVDDTIRDVHPVSSNFYRIADS